MDSILVKGNGALNGVIPIAGAKNACLTLMPATLLSEEPLTLTNAPRLSDIRTMTQLLQSLGAEVATLADGQVLARGLAGVDLDRIGDGLAGHACAGQSRVIKLRNGKRRIQRRARPAGRRHPRRARGRQQGGLAAGDQALAAWVADLHLALQHFGGRAAPVTAGLAIPRRAG